MVALNLKGGRPEANYWPEAKCLDGLSLIRKQPLGKSALYRKEGSILKCLWLHPGVERGVKILSQFGCFRTDPVQGLTAVPKRGGIRNYM